MALQDVIDDRVPIDRVIDGLPNPNVSRKIEYATESESERSPNDDDDTFSSTAACTKLNTIGRRSPFGF